MTTKKVILITGASSGIGESIAIHLAEKGHIVYGASRNIVPNNYFHTLTMDVTDENSVKNAIAEIFKKQGRIDVLINNAGLASLGPLEYIKTEDMETVFRTNVFGSMNTIKSVLPIMRHQSSGLIINVSSIVSLKKLPMPYSGMYNSSKAALERYTETLRSEVSKFGIKCCFLQLGGIADTDVYANSLTAEHEGDKVYDWAGHSNLVCKYISNGLPRDKVTALTEKIISSTNVKACYRICKFPERILISLRMIFPEKISEKIVEMYLKLQ